MAKARGALRRFMRLCKASFLILLLLFLPVPGHTLVELESPSGNAFFVLKDGEEVQLTWRNSLFGQQVTERFVASGGFIWLEEVSFEDRNSGHAVEATPQDLADLYHTGGAFRVKGVHRPFSEVVFRLGEIGKPRLRVKGEELSLYDEAGFGGRVVLKANRLRLISLLRASAGALVRRLPSWLFSSHPGAP